MRAFDATLGGGGISANRVDVQLVQRPPELRVARTFDGARLVDPENAVLVAVERERLAVAPQILARGLKIRERRLSAREVNDHESAGGVVDIDKGCAHRRAIFEPAMLAAIDLNQLTQARSTRTRLLDLGRSQPAWNPKACVDLQPPHGLLGNSNAVAHLELLSRQRRSKVRVMLAQDLNDLCLEPRTESAIAASISTPRDQTHGSVIPIQSYQSSNLAARHAEPFGSPYCLELTIHHGLNALEPVEIPHRHAHPG